MDSCKIYHTTLVVDTINKNGHQPLFTLPCFSSLSPTEECRSNIKGNLSDENSKKHQVFQKLVKVEDFLDWVSSPETYWDRRMNKMLDLKGN